MTSPTSGVLASNVAAFIEGTATDMGGGSVASVEVSVDGGKTWHRAEGTERWRYDFRLPEGFDACLDSGLSLKGAINDCALLYTPIAILPAKSDVHRKIEYPK